MKNGNQFDPQGGMAVLLLGESGVGKSTLAMEWPDPYFVLSDRNILYAAERANKAGKRWWFDYADADESGKTLDMHLRWDRSQALLDAAAKAPEVRTLVDDGLTFLETFLHDKIIKAGSQAEKPLTVGGVQVMTQSMWNPAYSLLRNRIINARASGKPYIMCAHLTAKENEVTKATEYKPAIGGQIRDRLGAFFSEVWCLDAEPVAVDAKHPRGVKYVIRTAPTHRIKILRTTIGLPAVFEPGESSEWKALLAQFAKPATAATISPPQAADTAGKTA